ncbi:MAG TPA: hypothetical protein VIC33_13695 [Vicinamibacterales bacterium]|jgi:hypothetical protein
MIVRRGCSQTFDRLQEMFADDGEIQVVWDRRATDRRRRDRRGAPRQESADRRQTDRRKPTPQSWLTLDFIVVKDDAPVGEGK